MQTNEDLLAIVTAAVGSLESDTALLEKKGHLLIGEVEQVVAKAIKTIDLILGINATLNRRADAGDESARAVSERCMAEAQHIPKSLVGRLLRLASFFYREGRIYNHTYTLGR